MDGARDGAATNGGPALSAAAHTHNDTPHVGAGGAAHRGRPGCLRQQPVGRVHLRRPELDPWQSSNPSPLAVLACVQRAGQHPGRGPAGGRLVAGHQLRARRPGCSRLSRVERRRAHPVRACALRHHQANARAQPASGAFRQRIRWNRDGVRADLAGPSASDGGGQLRHAAHRIDDGVVLPSHALCRHSRARRPNGPPGGMASRCCPAPWGWPAKR